VLKNIGLLGFGPLAGEPGEAVEIFLVNHNSEEPLAIQSTGHARFPQGRPARPAVHTEIWVCLEGGGILESL
jgi:hypothetical protein